jgi:hypothetical protein
MKYVPVKPVLRSPLLTHQHRWSGLAPVIPQSVVNNAEKVVDLSSNPFAQMLASPSRVDRVNKIIIIPRDLLLRFSLVKGPGQGNASDVKDQLWLVPNVEQFKSLSSDTYIANGLTQLKGRKWQRFASLEVITNNYNLTSMKDIRYNEQNWKLVNKLYLEVLIQELQGIQPVDDGRAVKIVINEDKLYKINPQGDIILNLGVIKLDHPLFEELKSLLQDINRISFKETKFISYLLKFVTYNTI